MITVFAITDWTDGQDDMHLRILGAKHIDGLLQIVGTCIDRQFFFLKERLRPLLTVIDDLARFLQTIHMIGSKSEESRLD